MKKAVFISVSSHIDNRESTTKNIADILNYIGAGWEIISDVGDGAGGVNYILVLPEELSSELPPRNETGTY